MRGSRAIAVLSLAGLTYSLAQTTIISALTPLADQFHAGTTDLAWTYSGFLLASAVATPLFGRLGDMFGKRRMLIAALALFLVGSIVAAFGRSLDMIILGRCIQGLGGGIFPLSFALARDLLPLHERSRGIGTISAMVGVGGGLGLLVGGVLVDNVSWQSTFWVNAGLAASAAICVRAVIPSVGIRTPGRVDIAGAVLLGMGIVLPLLALTRTASWGWMDVRTVGLVAVGAAVLVAWFGHERRSPNPLVDLDLFRRRPVLLTNTATLLAGLGIFGSFLAIPELARVPIVHGGLGLSATGVGLLLLPGSMLMLFAGPASGMLGDRFGNRVPLILGVGLGAIGLLALGVAHHSRGEMLLATLPLYAGMGLAFAAMPNLIGDAVPNEQTGEATGINALIRSVGAGLGGEINASVLAAHLGRGGTPLGPGFTAAFLLGSAFAGVGVLAAIAVPRRRAAAALVAVAAP